MTTWRSWLKWWAANKAPWNKTMTNIWAPIFSSNRPSHLFLFDAQKKIIMRAVRTTQHWRWVVWSDNGNRAKNFFPRLCRWCESILCAVFPISGVRIKIFLFCSVGISSVTLIAWSEISIVWSVNRLRYGPHTDQFRKSTIPFAELHLCWNKAKAQTKSGVCNCCGASLCDARGLRLLSK